MTPALCHELRRDALRRRGLMLSLLRDFAGETQPQKRGDRRLLGAHVFDVFFEIGVGLRCQGFEQRAVDITVEDRRMDVASTANCRRIAEMPRDLFDGAHNRLLALALGVEMTKSAQRLRREMRAGPGAEIFRGNLFAGDLAEIRVDLLRADDVLIALIVEILEQFVAGQVAAPFDDARESAIVDVALVAIAALAPEAEMDMAALDADMAVAQG